MPNKESYEALRVVPTPGATILAWIAIILIVIISIIEVVTVNMTNKIVNSINDVKSSISEIPKNPQFNVIHGWYYKKGDKTGSFRMIRVDSDGYLILKPISTEEMSSSLEQSNVYPGE